MWISGPTEGLENIFLLLQSTSNPDKRVCAMTIDIVDKLVVFKSWLATLNQSATFCNTLTA